MRPAFGGDVVAYGSVGVVGVVVGVEYCDSDGITTSLVVSDVDVAVDVPAPGFRSVVVIGVDVVRVVVDVLRLVDVGVVLIAGA